MYRSWGERENEQSFESGVFKTRIKQNCAFKLRSSCKLLKRMMGRLGSSDTTSIKTFFWLVIGIPKVGRRSNQNNSSTQHMGAKANSDQFLTEIQPRMYQKWLITRTPLSILKVLNEILPILFALEALELHFITRDKFSGCL